MNEQKAREILGSAINGPQQKKEGLSNLGWYLHWEPGKSSATLDGDYTAEELKAIAWWMENNG